MERNCCVARAHREGTLEPVQTVPTSLVEDSDNKVTAKCYCPDPVRSNMFSYCARIVSNWVGYLVPLHHAAIWLSGDQNI